MTPDLLITNIRLLPGPARMPAEGPGFIVIDQGRIIQTGSMEQCPPLAARTTLDGHGQLAMSGLVNGHCHAAMTLFRGLADDLALGDWLHNHIFPAEALYVQEEMVYHCSKLAAAEMLLSGITTVADGYFFADAVCRAFVDAGIRAVPAQAVVDFPAPGAPDPSRAVAEGAAFIRRWAGNNPCITPAVFAHSPYTCSVKTLTALKRVASDCGVPFFIHVAETKAEYDAISDPQGRSPIQHLEAIGVLDELTICVHAVWADDQDMDILARHGCSVITCPQSNMKLASGIAPLQAMHTRGIRLGIGTDGAASNNGLDLFREMDICAKLHKLPRLDPVGVPAAAILEMATSGGAQALGLGGHVGSLVPGNSADIILVDIDQPHLQPFYSPNLLVYGASGSDVRSVIVNGRLVVREQQLLTFELNETMEYVRTLASSIH